MAVEEMAVEEMAVEEMAVALNKYRFVFKYGFFFKPRNGGSPKQVGRMQRKIWKI